LSQVIVIYLRVSTEEQATKGHSLPEQREACLARAREIARQLEAEADVQIREFVDDYGGDILERPVLEEMRQLIRSERVTHLVCLDPDRFSRSLKWQLLLADEIETRGTRLVFVQQEYDPADMMSRAFFHFRGLMSEIDKAKILERTSRGKRGKLKAGGRPNGAAPFGYRHIKEEDRLAVYEPEARWVRAIFDWVASEGLGIHLVTKRLNDLGVPTRRSGGRWYRSTVRGMLRNSTYAGEMQCNRIDTRGLGAIRRLPRAKRRPLTPATRPPAEWIPVPVPAIITRAQFDRVQAILASGARSGRRARPGLLSGLARCGACGGRMTYARVTGADRTYLRCLQKYPHQHDGRPGSVPCDSPHYRAEGVERGVWNQLLHWLLEPSLVAEHLATGPQSPAVAGGRDRLQRQLLALQEQLAEKQREQLLLLQAAARRQVSQALADQQLAQLQRHVEQIEAAIRRTQSDLERAAHTTTGISENAGQDARAIVAEQEAIRGRLASLAPAQRHELARRLIQSVTLYRDGRWAIAPC